MNIFSRFERSFAYSVISKLFDLCVGTKSDLIEIKRLIKDMSKKQDELNAKLAEITAKQAGQEELLMDLGDRVSDEAEEVRAAVAELRAMIEEGNVDFSGLRTVTDKLDAHTANLQAVVDSVDSIYEVAEDEEEEGDEEVPVEPTPAPPVEEPVPTEPTTPVEPAPVPTEPAVPTPEPVTPPTPTPDVPTPTEPTAPVVPEDDGVDDTTADDDGIGNR